MVKYDCVVISGGHIKGLVVMGALEYCMNNSLIDADLWVGTSIGAIIAYFIVIGLSPIRILTYIIKYRDIFLEYSNIDFVKLSQNQGGVSYEKFQTMLEKVTIEETGCLYTLGKIKEKFGKTLVCCTYNYTKGVTEYLNPIDNPDIPAILACRMSSSVPFFFEKFKYNNCFYIDGGLQDNFPIDFPINNTLNMNKKKILGLNIKTESNPDSQHKMHVFIENIIMIMMSSTANEKIKIFKDKADIIQLNCPKVNIWDSVYHPKWMIDSFSSGYKQGTNYFENKSKPNEKIEEDIEEGSLC